MLTIESDIGVFLSDISVLNLAIRGDLKNVRFTVRKHHSTPFLWRIFKNVFKRALKKNPLTDPYLGTGFALCSPEVGQFNSN